MTSTHVLIKQYTVLSGGASSVTLSSIPQTYTNLKLLISAQDTSTNNNESSNMFMTVNGITSGYSNKFVYGTNSTTGTANNSNNLTDRTQIGQCPKVGAVTWSNTEVYIQNYTDSSTKYYSVNGVSPVNSQTTYQNYITFVTGSLPTTSGITTMNLTTIAGNFSEGSTFYLYGIKNS
jgi:hypothetical protein